MKLYYHQTDGGAKYLTDKFILCQNGHKEGTFDGAKYIVRIDGDITKDAELTVRENCTETTKVIFRKFKDGDIIALFPELAGDMNPATCLSYQHTGQHSAADCLRNTKPARLFEYKDLYKELIAIGYKLKIAKKMTRKDFNIRKEQLYR